MSKTFLPIVQAAWVCFVCPLSSCGLTDAQRHAVRDFGQAAKAVSEFAEAELPRMRNDLVEINQRIKKLGGDVGTETVLATKVPDFDGALDPDRITAAVQAVQGLAGYAAALIAVVDYDSEKDLKAAADNLSRSIKGLKVNGNPLLKEGEADAITDVVRHLGGFFVERARANAVRKIVTAYRSQVPRLVAVLKNDFDPNSPSGGFAVELFTRAKDLAGEAKGKSEEGSAHSSRTIRRQNVTCELSVVVLDKLAEANDTLAKILEDDKHDRLAIQELFKSVKDLLDKIKVLTKQ